MMEQTIQYTQINIKQIVIILIFAMLISLAGYILLNTRHYTTTQTIPQVEVLQWTADTAWVGGW